MLTKEQTDRYEISARKIGKAPKDIEQWIKEKEETARRVNEAKQNTPKEKAEVKEPDSNRSAS